MKLNKNLIAIGIGLITMGSASAQNADFSLSSVIGGVATFNVAVGGTNVGTATLSASDNGSYWNSANDYIFGSGSPIDGSQIDIRYSATDSTNRSDLSITLNLSLNAGWVSDGIIVGNTNEFIGNSGNNFLLGNGGTVYATGSYSWNTGGAGNLVDNININGAEAWGGASGSYTSGTALTSDDVEWNNLLDWTLTSGAGATSATWSQSATGTSLFTDSSAVEGLRFDAQLRQVPEPSSALLGGIAGALLLFRRRK